MQKLKNIAVGIKDNAKLSHFLGDNYQLMSYDKRNISKVITTEWLEVAFPESEMPEDQGRLYLYPVNDNEFYLQLIYLQENENNTTATVCMVTYQPGFFDHYDAEVLMANQPFRFDQTTEQQFSICSQTRLLLEQLQQEAPIAFIQSLQQQEIMLQLLRRSLQCMTLPFTACNVPACRFLSNESEREKILEARRIIEEQLDRTLTIRELSRMVAMNECYLKKGFKTLLGKTIHEYQQQLRISRAKQLLQQQGRSVSDVANTLGYSSISHFSTAFKKATGMKPCELLK